MARKHTRGRSAPRKARVSLLRTGFSASSRMNPMRREGLPRPVKTGSRSPFAKSSCAESTRPLSAESCHDPAC